MSSDSPLPSFPLSAFSSKASGFSMSKMRFPLANDEYDRSTSPGVGSGGGGIVPPPAASGGRTSSCKFSLF